MKIAIADVNATETYFDGCFEEISVENAANENVSDWNRQRKQSVCRGRI